MSFNNRSDALIELLKELTQAGHKYVLVGGYAVSAFNARFSTDLDIVVAPDSKLNSSNSSNDRTSRKRTATPRNGSTTLK
jgi:predicted nucleotidyltransferase component of viral defense system